MNSNHDSVENGCIGRIDVGKIARHSARKNAPKAGATKKIGDKRRKPPKHKKPLRDDIGG